MKTKEIKGITLITLAITIVILLILAGISISALTNQGLFKNAKVLRMDKDTTSKKGELDKILNKFKNKYKEYLSTAYVLHIEDLRVEDEIVFLPVYMTCLL